MASTFESVLDATRLGQWTIRRWRSSQITRAVGTLAGGSALAQALSLVTAPITTRLYDPSDYGLAAVLASIVGVLSILATFRYEMAIILPREEKEAHGILLACLVLTCISSAVAALLAWLCGAWFFGRLGVAGLYRYWWMVPASLLGAGLYQSFYVWALRRKDYLALTRTRLQQAVGAAFTTIGMGCLWKGPLGLILGAWVSMSLGARLLGRRALGSMLSEGFPFLFRRVATALRSYGRFATFTTGAALLNSTGLLLPPLLFAALYSQEIVGSFSLAQRVVLLPMTVVGTAVAQVFLGEASAMVRERPSEVPGFFQSVTRKMALMALGLLLMGAVCPFAFPIAFGSRWQTAGVFAAMLSVLCAAQLVVSPISNIATLMQRQDCQLALDALRTIAVLFGICMPAHYGGPAAMAVGGYALAQTLTYVVSYFVYRNLACRCACSQGAAGLVQPEIYPPARPR